MTYTYDLTNVTNIERVRFAIGDTSAPFIFADDEINFQLAEYEQEWRLAVLACVRSIIARLAEPDFQADWLRVDNSTALEAWRAVLRELQNQYGFGGVRTRAVDVTRGDW